MNYEIHSDDIVKASNMVVGQMGYIVVPGDNNARHLIWMAADRMLFSLTNPFFYWSAKCGDDLNISVRLLHPGETVTIRGK